MAHQNHIVDRLTNRLSTILPEHIREDAPIFESFLSSYFEYLESEIIVIEDEQVLTAIQLEDGTVIGDGNLVTEDSSDLLSNRILIPRVEPTDAEESEPIVKGEYIYGKNNGSVAKVKVRQGNVIIVDTVSGTGFAVGETIEGRDGGQTAIVKTYKENSIVASNRLLDYSNIDQTLETFLEYFQKDFIPSLDLADTQNKRLTLKNISTLYKQKGTAESVEFLMRILYGQSSSVKYPIDETIFASKSDYSEVRKMVVVMEQGGIPEATDRIIQYNVEDPSLKDAEAVVETVEIINTTDRRYGLSISRTHRGTFTENSPVVLVDRDGITRYPGTTKGIISELIVDDSSTTFGLESESGDLLLEDNSALLFEGASTGSMYNLNDKINFTGAKTDTSVVEALTTVSELSRGSIEEIYIESAGTGYSANDIIIFENANTEGSGAEAIIGAVGDELILENATVFDQYELIATAGQTKFGGVDSNGDAVRDLNNKPVALNGLDVTVLVDGLEQDVSLYTVQNDGVLFDSSPTTSGGERVELVTKFSRVSLENGDQVYLEGGDQRIRKVTITSGGAGYQTFPQVFVGGYLYFDKTVSITGFSVGELITGQSSNATSSISRIDTKNNRLVVRRSSTDTGTYQDGELIVGGSSSAEAIIKNARVTAGTGAKLFAWSSKIGGVEKVRITNQGYDFDENAVISSTSFDNMLTFAPTTASALDKGVQITGVTSGATGTIVSYDTQRNLLKFTDRQGTFLVDEKVTYGNDSFKVLKYDPYDARGKLSGEGITNDNFFGDTGYLSNEFSNIQDGRIYQTHSYIIKVGESIEKYRSIVKDLVHPAGHIFFGEVAVERVIASSASLADRFAINQDNRLGIINTTFVPTILIELEHTEHIIMEDSTRDSENKLLYENGDRIENEDAFEPKARTQRQTQLLIHTKADELSNMAMAHVLRDYLNEGAEVERHRVETIKKFISSATQTQIANDISDPVAPTASLVTVINQRSPRLDGVVSVLNLATADNDYLKLDREDAVSPIGVRPQDQGKVYQIADFSEEMLVFEDGTNIQLEEPRNRISLEPERRNLEGENMALEDGSGTILLEDETIPEHIERFISERSRELFSPYFYSENNMDRIVMETGEPLVHEQLGTGTLSSFVPHGPTIRSINKIAFQDTYRIAYYMLDEETGSQEEDRFILESGTDGGSGSILLEDTERDGLRISQLNELLQTFYIAELPRHENRRTNIAYSSYVNSSNITNGNLALLIESE
jgi:hypothetical protein